MNEYLVTDVVHRYPEGISPRERVAHVLDGTPLARKVHGKLMATGKPSCNRRGTFIVVDEAFLDAHGFALCKRCKGSANEPWYMEGAFAR